MSGADRCHVRSAFIVVLFGSGNMTHLLMRGGKRFFSNIPEFLGPIPPRIPLRF